MKKTASYKILLTVVLLLSQALLYAQAITGRVTDAATGQPLKLVSVYFDGTYQGAVTDSLGNFTLSNTKKTSSPLVVSFMGYESQRINSYVDVNLNIALKRKVIELTEVSIGATDEISRAKAMKIFLEEFIGEDTKDCVIDNPDEIYFRYYKKKDLLLADAEKPLIITNKTLGYKITYFLTSFSHTPYLQTKYKGNYFFKDDTAGLKPAKIKAIMKARDVAYYGSRMHFIRSLWANELGKNHFAIYKTPKGVDQNNTYKIDAANILGFDDVVQIADGQKFIMLAKEAGANNEKFNSNEVFVTYQNRNESLMQQKDGYTGVIIDENGFHDEGLEWKGNISVYRISMLLPFEFMPSKELK